MRMFPLFIPCLESCHYIVSRVGSEGMWGWLTVVTAAAGTRSQLCLELPGSLDNTAHARVWKAGCRGQDRTGDDRCVKQEWKGECTDITVDPLGEHQLGCLQPALGCHVPAPGTMWGNREAEKRQAGLCEQKAKMQRRRCVDKKCGNLMRGNHLWPREGQERER